MPKFVEYRDIFKFNKQLLDDDYNQGKAYVQKADLKREFQDQTNGNNLF